MGKSKAKSDRPVIQMFRPMRADAVLELAKRYEAGMAASEEYDLGDISIADLNGSRLTPADVKAAFEAGKLPALYQPALVSIAKAKGADFALIGQEAEGQKAPANWPSALGVWKPGRKASPFRTNHSKDLRRNIVDPATNYVESGKWALVLGDGDRPAVFNISGSKGDNSYAHAMLAAKSLALGDQKPKLANLFIRLNTKAGIVRMTGDGNGGAEVVVLAFQSGSPGYVERDDKRLTADQVRKAFKVDDDGKLVDPDAVKALKWVPLDEPIIGTPFTESALISRVTKSLDANRTVREGESKTALQRYTARKSRKSDDKAKRQTPEQGIVTNLRTMTRTAPQVAFCFGLRHALAGAGVAFPCWGDTRDDKRFNVVIGVRVGDELTETDRKRVGAAAEAAKAKAPKEPKAPKAPKPKAPKAPKADKPKAAPKVRKPKAPKVDKPAEIKGEPAAPVSDTADSGEPATTEPATVAEPVASGS